MTEPQDLNDAELRDRAVAAARGDAPFDMLITGGAVADVALHALRPADVGIVGELIASVHAPGARADAARVIDASGCVVSPGLIDAHMHVESSMVSPATYADAAGPRGVTTAVWDPHELGNVAGRAGVDFALRAGAAAAIRFLVLAPSCVPSAPGFEMAGADFDGAAIASMLAEPDVAGLAEVMDMAAVIARAPRMRAITQAGLQSGKPVCGHARSLSGAALQAYAAAGVASDHELTSATDLLEKLAAGLTVELRGSHDHLLPELAEALQALPQLPPTLTLCTDDVFPDDLDAAGALDDVLRRLVRRGLDPLRALQAATLNAALRLGRPDLGLIAPGKRADVAVFEDLIDFRATHVLRDGAPLQPSRAVAPPEALARSMRLSALSPEDFELRAAGPFARVATIDKPRFTQWGEAEFAVTDGLVDLPPDCTRIAVAHRHGRASAAPKVGVLRHWGAWRGAFATTISHDSHNLTVFGHDAADMAVAANALIASGGGMAVAREGALVARIALPVGGLISEAPLREIARDFAALRAAMDAVVEWEPPYLTFKALVGATLACNAGPHQTDQGIADPHGGQMLSAAVLEDGRGGSR